MELSDVELDVDDKDALSLMIYAVSDIAAVLWGANQFDLVDVQMLLGDVAGPVLGLVGLVGLWSLLKTFTNV